MDYEEWDYIELYSYHMFSYLSAAAAAAAVVEESALNRSVDTSLTPKQLRFHLPKVQARAELRAKRSPQFSADQDKRIEEEEERVEEEEEEMEEEVEHDTPEVEEQTKMNVERRVLLTLDYERWVLLGCVVLHC